MSAEASRAWAALLRVHGKLALPLDKELHTETGLHLPWYDALHELHSDGGQLTMTELAARIGLTRAHVSRLVDQLIDAGLTLKTVNPADRRFQFVTITKEGRQRLQKAAPIYQAAIERQIGSATSAVRLRQVSETLEEIVVRLS